MCVCAYMHEEKRREGEREKEKRERERGNKWKINVHSNSWHMNSIESMYQDRNNKKSQIIDKMIDNQNNL